MREQTLRRLKLLAPRVMKYKDDPAKIPKDERDEFAMMFASTFNEFSDFAELGLQFLGYKITEMQLDIAEYMQHGPMKSMVTAQRGEAKSTLAALYAVWSLIVDQSTRVLIVSGGERQASDVASLVIRLMETWGLLCWIRADPARGDRTSYENYDIHCDLKPLSASASVACVGITAQLQGKRADLLIPDDVETTKNSLTQVMREQLLMLTKEFAAINTHGKTLYLGTPQTKDSIYRTLPGRGYEIRVWPGRVPTIEEEERYGETLAPYVKAMIDAGKARKGFGLDGTRGEVTDPGRYTEDDLIEKEVDFGPEGFQLQYMLDTTLTDALRTRIKLSDMIVASLGTDAAPSTLYYAATPQTRVADLPVAIRGVSMYYCSGMADLVLPYQHKVMQIDPAGCGGDEVAFSICGALNSYIHLMAVGGLQGGLCEENCNTLIDLMLEFDVKDVVMEANMGHGTASMVLMNALAKRKINTIGITDEYAKGQKERRIIDTISPVTRKHKLVVHTRALEMDNEYCMKYSSDKRNLYSVFTQMMNITYDRQSLPKDDRADSVAGCIQRLQGYLSVDEDKEAEKLQALKMKEFMDNPMGYDFKQRNTHRGTWRHILN